MMDKVMKDRSPNFLSMAKLRAGQNLGLLTRRSSKNDYGLIMVVLESSG